MNVYQKRCWVCRDWYRPDPRTRRFQKVCGKTACRRERQRRAYGGWAARNRDYDDARRDKIRRWAKDSDYWKHYRQTHAAYAERNRAKTRERLRRRRAMFAKQNAIRKNAVGYLQGLRTGAWFAKQNAMTHSIDGILIFLTLREVFAKQSLIALADAAVKSSHP
jgi:hypothetical protein